MQWGCQVVFLFVPPLSRLSPSPNLVGGPGAPRAVPADQYPGMRLLGLVNTSRRPREVNEVPAGQRHSALPRANHKWWIDLNEIPQNHLMITGAVLSALHTETSLLQLFSNNNAFFVFFFSRIKAKINLQRQ